MKLKNGDIWEGISKKGRTDFSSP